MQAAPQISYQPANENSPESVLDNVFWQGAAPRLSICVPSYRADCSDLIDALLALQAGRRWPRSSSMTTAARIVPCSQRCSIRRVPAAPVRIVTHVKNRGRGPARNSAIAHARSRWVLLLDADMSPDTGDLIIELSRRDRAAGRSRRWWSAVVPAAFWRRRAANSPCIAGERENFQSAFNAHKRNAAPGRCVFSSNAMLVHKKVLEACPSHEGFARLGLGRCGLGAHARRPLPDPPHRQYGNTPRALTTIAR